MGNLCSVSISADQSILCCWDSVVRQATYISKLEENLNKLKTSLEKLQGLGNDLRQSVDIAERQQGRRLHQVQLWLSSVDDMETEVNELTRECQAQENKNCWSKNRLGKKIAKKLIELDTKANEGKDLDATVGRFSSYSVPVPAEERPSDPTVGLQSTLALVWKHITNDEVGIIGIYGMGGVGKTTLLTQINNEFLKRDHNFESVIWIVVSKDLNIEKIQDDIGKRVGCCDDTWTAKDQDEKATCIFRVMRNKKFVLLLDDVWERIDPKRLGISFSNKKNKCKLVFTTRSKEVCGQMEAQKTIKVECLAWEQAWNLFHDKVGEDAFNSHPEIPKLAEDVARECGGLPLALITIGRAMACKTTSQEWKRAIEVLRKSASEFSGMEDKVLGLLKFSYDNLPDARVQSCFLYCALFPEDFKISKIDLIDYWIGEGLLGEHDTVNEATNHGYEIVGTLISACLLENTLMYGYNDSVKMHDVTRDMALWIANDCGNAKENFVVQAGAGLSKAPKIGKWMLATRMSLMNNSIKDLTEVATCPNLLTLLLAGNCLTRIEDDFFQFMPTLAVLDLSWNVDITELPSTISKLVSLQYLNLSFTLIEGLPIELVGLVKLKILNLTSTTSLEPIALEVISGLTMLQVLKMENSFRSFSDGQMVCIDKLDSLKFLDCLSLTITSIPDFQKLTNSQKLQNCTQSLEIRSFKSAVFNISSLEKMRCLNKLHMFDHNVEEFTIGSASLFSSKMRIIRKTCFHSLSHVSIGSCNQLKDVTWLIAAPNLMWLRIEGCPLVEEVICHEKWKQLAEVERSPKLFGKLEMLVLGFLRRLESIYWEALPFPHLKHIRVRHCEWLRKLPFNSNTANGQKIIIEGEPSWWKSLEWEDEATKNVFLPCCVPLFT